MRTRLALTLAALALALTACGSTPAAPPEAAQPPAGESVASEPAQAVETAPAHTPGPVYSTEDDPDWGDYDKCIQDTAQSFADLKDKPRSAFVSDPGVIAICEGQAEADEGFALIDLQQNFDVQCVEDFGRAHPEWFPPDARLSTVLADRRMIEECQYWD